MHSGKDSTILQSVNSTISSPYTTPPPVNSTTPFNWLKCHLKISLKFLDQLHFQLLINIINSEISISN